MKYLPPSDGALPAGLSLEKPMTGLASLTITDSMRQLSRIVMAQWQNKAAFAPLARHGIHPIRQLLFYGPPGNGKTTACQWIAGQLGIPLYRCRCESLIEGFLGGTTSNLANVLEWAAKQPACVILLDEVEQIFQSRQLSSGQCDQELSRAMTVYWQFLDRWTTPQLFVLATNAEERMDAAVMSRIELHLKFGPPTPDQCRSVIAYWSETLHEYGSATWAPQLLEQETYESFRALWHAIQRCVTNFVTEAT